MLLVAHQGEHVVFRCLGSVSEPASMCRVEGVLCWTWSYSRWLLANDDVAAPDPVHPFLDGQHSIYILLSINVIARPVSSSWVSCLTLPHWFKVQMLHALLDVPSIKEVRLAAVAYLWYFLLLSLWSLLVRPRSLIIWDSTGPPYFFAHCPVSGLVHLVQSTSSPYETTAEFLQPMGPHGRKHVGLGALAGAFIVEYDAGFTSLHSYRPVTSWPSFINICVRDLPEVKTN